MMMITSSCNSTQKLSHITIHPYFNVKLAELSKGHLFGNSQKRDYCFIICSYRSHCC